MNGFENIKDRVELREQFKEDTGGNWENSQGEVDVDYVLWLESKLFTTPDVVKSLPNDEEVKAHIDTMPYYGTCTTEYNEGFEDGVKWLKEQMTK